MLILVLTSRLEEAAFPSEASLVCNRVEGVARASRTVREGKLCGWCVHLLPTCSRDTTVGVCSASSTALDDLLATVTGLKVHIFLSGGEGTMRQPAAAEPSRNAGTDSGFIKATLGGVLTRAVMRHP